MIFNAISNDILSHILEYNAPSDTSSISSTCKQKYEDVKSLRELTTEKRINDKTNFLKTLGLYSEKWNNCSVLYSFNVSKIKEYLKSSHLNDKSLVANGTNDFVVDGNMIMITTDKSLYRESIIRAVIEFFPERSYSLVEAMANYNGTVAVNGITIYNCDDGRFSQKKNIIVLINNNNAIENYETHIKNKLSLKQQKMRYNSLTVILGPLVTKISGDYDWGFSGRGSLTSIVIPNSVTEIGASAFWGCYSLTSIVIPDSVTEIGEFAFWKCSSLTSIVIPDSVTEIGDDAFTCCSSLTSVVIPNSVTSIGTYAFDDCSSLTSIVIPDSVTSIDEWTFNGCSSLTYIVIPDSVTHIGEYAFWKCSSLTSIVLPKSVTHIGEYAFSHCFSLTSIVLPKSVTHIGENAFWKCTSLTSIVLPNSITHIGDSAFDGCTSLTSIVLPKSVTEISYGLFDGCTSLTSVVIPTSVTSIGDDAFADCSSLTSIVIPHSVMSALLKINEIYVHESTEYLNIFQMVIIKIKVMLWDVFAGIYKQPMKFNPSTANRINSSRTIQRFTRTCKN